MLSPSSTLDLSQNATTKGGHREYVCESPDGLEMVSTSSFSFESIATMPTSSSPRPDLSSVSPDVGEQLLPPRVAGNMDGRTHTIIEEVETIITTATEGVSSTDDEEGEGEAESRTSDSPIARRARKHRQSSNSKSDSYYSLDNSNTEGFKCQLNQHNIPIRVPFPELGLDVVDINFASELDLSHDLAVEECELRRNLLFSPEIRLTDLNSWDENWLFKKKRKSKSLNNYFTFTQLDFASESVRMFIPNPSQSAQPLIGEVPLEQLHDLSERNSPAASLTFSDEEEDIRQEHQEEQQDQLHQQDHKYHQQHLHNLHHQPQQQPHLPPQEKQPLRPQQQVVNLQKGQSESTLPKMTQGLTSEKKHALSPSLQSVNKNSADIVTAGKSTASLQAESTASARVVVTSMSPSKTITRNKSFEKAQLATSGPEISLPSFVPLSKRMESSRSDPCFLIKPCGASVQPNIVIQFCCRVKGSKPLGLAWFKGDTLLKSDDSFRIFSSGNEFVLEIKETRSEHTDTYSCVVYNAYGEQWSDFNLVVKPRSPHVACKKEGVHFGCSKVKATGIRGISVDRNKGQLPKVITQTWAERSRNEKNEKNEASTSSSPSMTPTLTHASQTGERNNNNISSASTFTSTTPCRSNKAQLPNSAKEPVTSTKVQIAMDNANGDSDHLYQQQQHEQHQHQQQDQVNRAPGTTGTAVVATCASTLVKINGNSVDGSTDGTNASGAVVSQTKDLSKFKRDYYVPNSKQHEEALNAVDEKVYHSSKVFITTTTTSNNNDSNNQQQETTATNTLDSDTPDHGTTFSLTTSDSGAESVWSRKASSQEDGLAPTDVDDLSDDLPATPSVAKLIRHFSRCDSDSLYRSSTFTSTGSIYEDCNGKGVTPRLRSSNVHEVSNCKPTSSYITLTSLDSPWVSSPSKLSTSASPTTSAITSSPSNEGYNSDDSAISSNLAKNPTVKQSVEVLPVKKASRSITKRASFWQKRCENGLISDSNVEDEFPPVESTYD